MFKKLVLLKCILLISLSILGQVKFKNFSNKDPYRLSIGIENLLFFEDSILYLKNGMERIEPINGLFRIKINNSGLHAYDLYNSQGKMETILFNADRLSDAKLNLGKLGGGGKISKVELMNNAYLSIVDSTKANISEIISFELTIVPHKGDVTTTAVKSNRFPKEIFTHIESLQTNSVILIEQVMVRRQDGIIRKIPGLSFQIN